MISRKINGLWGIDKFHGLPIPNFWIKVNVTIAHVVDVPLMHTHEADDQSLMKIGRNFYLVGLEVCKNNRKLTILVKMIRLDLWFFLWNLEFDNVITSILLVPMNIQFCNVCIFTCT